MSRGVETIVPNKKALGDVLRAGKKLNIYLGIDPTAPKIHLGHAVPLRKLQAFVELGHHVTFLIGDFTALIGDTSDKESERPILTKEEIETNFQTYKNQAEKILDFSKVTVRHNREWLSKIGYEDLIKLFRHFSLNNFISRELIKKRLANEGSVRFDEVAYPVMQGYDSYFLDTDLQIGGTDQIFNMQAGRTLQKDLRNKESFVLATGFLEGTDGRKMSKSWGNAIWLDDSPSDIFGKVMSLKDELVNQYFILATNLPLDKIPQSGHPMELKKKLALQIVSELHSENAAQKAQEEFENTFQKGEVAEDLIQEIKVRPGKITDQLMEAGIVASKSEAKRLEEQGAIEEIKPGLYRIGEKRFVKIT